MSTAKAVVAILVGALIVVVSWPSLRARWPHALPRSLAFLLVLALAVTNAEAWLADPDSLQQILSWVLLAASIPLTLHPLALLRAHGRPDGTIDTTRALVERGIYRWIRHPLYLALMLIAVGALLKRVIPLTLALAAGACALLYLTAHLEERHNTEKFGAAYSEYAARTKMFLPWVF